MVQVFKVIHTGPAAAALRQLVRNAMKEGLRDEVLKAARIIARRLEREPLVLGEPYFHLRALKLTVYTAVVPPLAVKYAVNEENRFVAIQDFKLLGRFDHEPKD